LTVRFAAVWSVLGAGVLVASTAGASGLVSVACGESARLRVSDGEPKQGSILVVEIRSYAPLRSVDGFSAGEALFFWHDTDRRVFQALLGVDFLKRPGEVSLQVRVAPESGPPIECGLKLRIAKAEFPVQRLSVAPKYVELSPGDLARSQEEAAELSRIFSSTTNERLWSGSFRAPVDGYEASGSFGKRRVFNNVPRSPHSGEDFPAPAKTPVLATARGRVVLARSLFFLGDTVILDHGFGLYSFYGHLSAIAVAPGTLVEAGAVIGNVGATGRVTGAHLHWGVRLGDARVNPMELISLTGSAAR
jgi:murein DD-endopeptidase MepM/ murein hydrolase activator NlpD